MNPGDLEKLKRPNGVSLESIAALVDREIKATLGKELAEHYSRSRSLMELGMTSPLIVELRGALCEALQVELPPTFLFEHPTGQAVIDYLFEEMIAWLGEWLYRIEWQETKAPSSGALAPGGHWLVVADAHGLQAAVADALRAADQHVTTATFGPKFLREDEDSYQLRVHEQEDFDRLAEELCGGQSLTGMIFLAGHSEPSDQVSFATIDAFMETHCEGLVRLANVLDARMIVPTRGVWVTDTSIPDDGTIESLMTSGAAALSRVIAAEYPRLGCRHLALDAGDSQDAQLACIVAEVSSGTDESEIAYRGRRRLVPRLLPEEVECVSMPAFDEAASYLVSGGLQPLGLQVARWYVMHGARSVVLLGDEEPSEEVRHAISELEDLGATVSTHIVHYDDPQSFEEIFRKIKRDCPPLKGVIHSAGILDDDLLVHVDWQRCQASNRMKIAASWHLHQCTAGLELDHFVLFSSAYKEFSPLGKAAGAVGNAFLDALAFYRRARGLPALTVVWGPWMLPFVVKKHRMDPWLQTQLAYLDADTGLLVLERILFSPEARLYAAQVEWTSVLGQENPLFEEMAILSGIRSRDFLSTYDALSTAEQTVSLNEYVTETLRRVFGWSATRTIEPSSTLASLGLEEAHLRALKNELEASLNWKVLIPPAVLSLESTVEELCDRLRGLLEGRPLAQEQASAQESEHEPIAIIGMACRFPGARDYREFWQNLVHGVDCISEIPESRWDWRAIYGDPKEEPGKTKVKWGGFIDDVDAFDPLFFNISPKEAAYIDPQHRLFLETVWHAMEDGGYSSQQIAGQKIGVYAGVSKNDYAELMREKGVEITPYVSTGTVHSILSNRVSYILDTHGPSESIDTACSSALVALHSAIRDLRNGECSMAFVGGVNAILSPTMYVSHTRSGMLSPDGRCKTFDAAANGYVRAEGVGVLMIKPLRDAIRDGDAIHAVIRGAVINHGGKSTGLTAPNVSAQADVVQAALDDAGLEAGDVTCIEAHGTGTPLGDPIEVDALKKVFGAVGPEHRCVLGAVKTHIGHLESASGIAGLIKMVLQLQHGVIPKNLHFEQLNPRLDLTGSPFVIAQTQQEWRPLALDGRPTIRRGAVSSFGMGGANGHVIVEEAPARPGEAGADTGSQLFPLSARKGRLLAYIRDVAKFLRRTVEEGQSVDLDSMAYTLQTGRDAFEERAIFQADSADALLLALEQYLSDEILDVAALPEPARKWLEGGELNWELEWDRPPLRCAGLPGYPFQRLSCWFDVDHQATAQLPASAPARISREVEIPAGEFFLKDHVVDGRSILPGVMYLELARDVATQLLPRRVVSSLHEVNWISPCVVQGDALVLRIELHGDGLSQFSIFEGEALRCTGEIAYGSSGVAPPKRDVHGLVAGYARQQSADEIYSVMPSVGLAQGPSLRVISEFHSDSGGALAKLCLRQEQSLADHVLHPSLMDAVYQTVLAHHFSEHADPTKKFLPYALQAVHWYRPLEAEMYAAVEELDDSDSSRMLKYRMQLLTASGEVAVSFEGFSRRPSLASAQENPLQDIFYVDQWTKQDCQADRNLGPAVLLFSSDDELADALSERVKVIRVGVGSQFRSLSAESYQINPMHADDFTALIAELKSQGTVISEVVIAWDQPAILSVLYLTQAVIKSRHFYGLLMLYTFERSDALDSAQYAMAAGFARTLIYENPRLELRSVETEAAAADERASLILQELSTSRSSPLLEISYVDNARWVRSAIPAPAIEQFEPKASLIRAGGTYLITGGLGGLGRIFARHLAQKYSANLVLLGRKPIDESVEEALAELQAGDNSVHYLSADVTDLDSLRHALSTLPEKLKQFHGVIHAAGLKVDSFIIKKDPESFATVVNTKVQGALNLDELTAQMPLDFMLLFSSIAALIPNQGQSDYAAANSFLDKFAQLRRKKRHGLTLAIGWPLWASGGMRVTDAQEEHLKEVFGMDPLPTSMGVRVFEHVLSYAAEHDISQVIVISGDKAKILAAFGEVEGSGGLSSLVDTIEGAGAESSARKTFKPGQPFIDGFSIEGTAAVPGACFLEMARQAAQSRYPDFSVSCISENYWPTALLIKGASVEAQTNLHFHGSRIAFEITSRGADGKELVHATGQLESKRRHEQQPAADLQKKMSEASDIVETERFYQTIHENADLRLAGDFRPVRQLHMLDKEAIAWLELNPDLLDDAFVIQPILFTGLEQCLLVYTALTHRDFHPGGIKLMPVSIEAVDLYAPFPQRCVIHLIPEKIASATNKLQKFNATIYSESGEVIAHIAGNTMRIAAATNAGKAGESPPAREVESGAEDYLRGLLSQVLAIPEQQMDRETDFESYGVNSQMIVELNTLLEKDLGKIPKTLFFEYANLAELGAYLSTQYPENFAHPSEPVAPAVDTQQGPAVREAAGPGAESYLRGLLVEVLAIPEQQLDRETDFESYGVNSQMIVELNTLLEKDLGKIPKTLFFEYANLGELGAYLSTHYPEKFVAPPPSVAQAAAVPKEPRAEALVSDIAIVGMSGRLPGARNLEEFWANLTVGRDSVSDKPMHQDLYSSSLLHEDILACKWGGSIGDVDLFDPDFFGIAPREAASIDPQERLFLRVAWEALMDAGMDPSRLAKDKRRMGVYVGAIWQDYQLIALEETLKGNPVAVSSLLYSIANRVSYTFNLKGPSLTVDTACSSSLTALHLACQSLILGESNSAIVGGVNLNLHPMKYGFLNNYEFLSEEGKCRSYGEGGSGYVPGEGVVAVVLKPLSQAIQDGDPIHGVIKASAINHGGKTRGFTVPDPTQQSEVILDALARAQVDPRDVSYVEGHGTGTALGDPVEIRGLELAYSKYTEDKQYCSIGSVKSNIGHLEAAAGLASLIKVLLQFRHKTIAPSIHSEILNKNIDFSVTPFYVQKTLSPWESTGPRLAAVSSFGAGGSYAHVILQEGPASEARKAVEVPGTESSYWVESKAPRKSTEQLLHPLLGEREAEPVSKARFAGKIDLKEQVFLRDHGVYDRIVFPGAGYLEQLLAGGTRHLHSRSLRLENVSFEAPLSLELGRPTDIELHLTASGNGFLGEIRSITTDAGTLHAHGQIQEAGDATDVLPVAIETLKERMASSVSQQAFYSRISACGMRLGPHFQTVQSIWVGDGELLVQASTADSIDGYLAYPPLLDACIQVLAIELDPEAPAELHLPIGCDRFDFYQPLPGEVYVHIRMTNITDKARAGDLTLIDGSSGAVVAKITGMQYRRTTQESLQQILAKETGVAELLYHWDWLPFRTDSDVESSPCGHWLILSDGSDATELCGLIESHGGSYRKLPISELPEDSEELIALLKSEPFDRIIHSAAGIGPQELSKASLSDAQQLGTASALRLIQALAELGGTEEIAITLLCDVHPANGSLLGLYKTAVLELPQLDLRFIRLESTVDAEQVFAAVLTQPTASILSLDGDGCRIASLSRITDVAHGAAPVLVSSSASYLITGGLGGLGLTVARWLIDKGAGRLVLTGRSPSNDDLLKDLRRGECRVDYVQADISSEENVHALVDEMQKSAMPLRGIFHLAGTLADASLREQTWEAFEAVYAAKVYGTLHLHTYSQDLDLFVTFSSIAASLGNPGQANYAAANAFMDALCEHRRQQGLPALSIAWGPWAEVGMAADLGERLARSGLLLLEARLGLSALEQLLSTDKAQATVARIDWSTYLDSMARPPNWLQSIAGSLAPKIDDRANLMSVPKADQASWLRELISDSLRATLGSAASTAIDPSKSFFDMGLDSLMAAELRNRLQPALGDAVSLVTPAIFDHGTVDELTAHIQSLIQEARPEEIQKVTPTKPALPRPGDFLADADLGDLKLEATKATRRPADAVLLTGVTGQLGGFLLAKVAARFPAARLHCLVRAQSEGEGLQRILSGLSRHKIEYRDFQDRIQPVLGDLSKPGLGISADTYEELARDVDVIFHAGAATNWSHSYEMLRPANINGTLEVIKLAVTDRAKEIHHISTIAVYPLLKDENYTAIAEDMDILHESPITLPYYQTKWVSEMQMRHARALGLKVNIYRPGSLVCDLEHGVPVTNELSYLIVEGCRQLGIAPDIDFAMNLTPHDVAADVVASIAASDVELNHHYHIVNPQKVALRKIIQTLVDQGSKIEWVSLDEWEAAILALDLTTSKNPVVTVFDVAMAFARAEPMDLSVDNTVQALQGLGAHFPVDSTELIAAYLKAFDSKQGEGG